MGDAEGFIDLGSLLSNLGDWLALPEAFTEIGYCTDFWSKVAGGEMTRNSRDNYGIFWKVVADAEQICLSITESDDVIIAQGILEAMIFQRDTCPLCFIGRKVSKADDQIVVEVMKRASADFRQSLLVTGGRLLAKGKRLQVALQPKDQLYSVREVARLVNMGPKSMGKHIKEWPEPDLASSGSRPARWKWGKIKPIVAKQFKRHAHKLP